MYPPSHIRINRPRKIDMRTAIQNRIAPLRPVEGTGAVLLVAASVLIEDISVDARWKKRRAKDTLQSEKPDGRKILQKGKTSQPGY
jgi:hypothetical protein